MGGEEQAVEFVHNVMEMEVCGAGGMLAAFEPLIVCIVSNPTKYSCAKLQAAATLSLSKYMLIRQGVIVCCVCAFVYVIQYTAVPSVTDTFSYFSLYSKSLCIQMCVLI